MINNFKLNKIVKNTNLYNTKKAFVMIAMSTSMMMLTSCGKEEEPVLIPIEYEAPVSEFPSEQVADLINGSKENEAETNSEKPNTQVTPSSIGTTVGTVSSTQNSVKIGAATGNVKEEEIYVGRDGTLYASEEDAKRAEGYVTQPTTEYIIDNTTDAKIGETVDSYPKTYTANDGTVFANEEDCNKWNEYLKQNNSNYYVAPDGTYWVSQSDYEIYMGRSVTK